MPYKRPLTSFQSSSCESAQHPRCTCRCHGALHGVSHQSYIDLESEILADKGCITDDEVADIISFIKGEIE
jgi:hypothetical protein